MPLPEIVAVPLYVPALSPAGEAVCVMVAAPPGGIVTVSPDVATSQLIGSFQWTVNVLVPVFVRWTPRACVGPPTELVYASEGGETVTPAEASDRSPIAWATTRKTVQTKIELILKRTAWLIWVRILAPTVIKPARYI